MSTMTVDLELQPDLRDPQYTSIWGITNKGRFPVGRVHNTGLGMTEALVHAFRDVRDNVRTRIGVNEGINVYYGSIDWTKMKLPITVEEKISEALDRVGISLQGSFGPKLNVEGGPRSSKVIYEQKMARSAAPGEIASHLDYILRGVGFEVFGKQGMSRFYGQVAAKLRDYAGKKGVGIDSPTMVQGIRRLRDLVDFKVKLAEIASAFKYVPQEDLEPAIKVASDKAVLLIAKFLDI